MLEAQYFFYNILLKDMRSITSNLSNNLYNHVQSETVARADAYPIKTFRELVEVIAELSYLNKDNLLFFRGQIRDYKNKAQTSTIYPSIYRGDRLSKSEIEIRFDILNSAARRLCDSFEKNNLLGHTQIRRRRYIQWSILQHYEICPTPLLDLTQSIGVACSFAFLSSDVGDPFLFTFGLPFMTNRISINSEQDIVNIRLLSICPPDALRPYFQEGYWSGTDEITSDYYSKDELDFNNRLITKFRLIRSKSFWRGGFQPIPKRVLYPKNDKVGEICKDISAEIGSEIEPGRLGLFLQNWTNLENLLMEMSRRYQQKVYSLRESISILRSKRLITSETFNRINKIRQLRNMAVHEPHRIEASDLIYGVSEVQDILSDLKELGL